MRRERILDNWIGAFQVAVDAAMIFASFHAAYFVRFYSGIFHAPKGIPAFDIYLANFPAGTVLMLLVFKILNLYDRRGTGRRVPVWRVAQAVTLGMFVLMSLTFFYRGVVFSRLFFVLAWFLCCVMAGSGRFLLSLVERRLYRRLGLHRNVLLIGNGSVSERILKSLERTSSDAVRLAGMVLEGSGACSQAGGERPYPCWNSIEQLPDIIAREKIDEVILTVPDIEQKKIVDVILACEKEMVQFRMVPTIFEILTSQVDVESFHGVTLIGLKQFPLEKAMNRFWKRCMDISGALAGLVLAIPLFACIAFWIKRDSPGPVFFRQTRVGEDGQTFEMIKFRTMVAGAEDKTGPVWASENDQRRTRIGRHLRRFNLDELPQLWNVLKGEMSLVGPRPERPHFVNEFKDRVPRYMSRHKIKSGMTGWAQVNGLRGNTSILDRVKYDLYYLENWSILFDLKILLKTLFTRENAY